MFSSLSYSIASTFKRVTIITATSILLKNTLSLKNVLGIVIATFGAVAYNVASRRSKKERRLPQLPVKLDVAFLSAK